VIAIMSILTIITVSQFGSAQKRSRDVARKADLNSLSKALLSYYADYGDFPEDISWGGDFKDKTGYIYMKLVPSENSQNNGVSQYCYAISATGDKFALFSELENEEDEEYNKYNNLNPYVCGGKNYNFAIFSPNAGYADF